MALKELYRLEPLRAEQGDIDVRTARKDKHPDEQSYPRH